MARYNWPLDTSNAWSHMSAWPGGDASSLVVWALLAADGLAYLVDLDNDLRAGRSQQPSQAWQAVEFAHSRWAATSAITVLNLAAAALGRLHLPPKPVGQEYSLEDFYDRRGGGIGKQRRDALTLAGRRWIESTHGNKLYRTVLRARNPFTHGRVNQSVTVFVGTVGTTTPYTASKSSFHVGPKGQEVDSRDLIEMAFRVVDRRVGAYLAEVRDGTLWP